MYLLKRFCGTRFERINAILDQYEGYLSRYINLIASASYPFPEVVDALANPFTAFPCEGLPGSRYFPASSALDSVETVGEEMVRKLFGLGLDHQVTIQPHSGTQANQIVYNAVLGPDDVVLSLRPSHGGHISHTVLVGRRNRAIHFSATAEGELDYEEVARLAWQHRPRLIVAGSSSLPRPINFQRLGSIATEVGAFLHADLSHTALFVMTNLHPPVFPFADFVTFNTMKNLRGPCGGVLVYRSSLGREVARSLFPGTQGGPSENALFAKVVCFTKLLEIDLNLYAAAIVSNARIIAASLLERGIEVVTGGTDSHLVLVDLRGGGLTGVEAESLCEQSHILLNRNLVYDDQRSPWIASGIRIGTSCITTLDYSPQDTRDLAEKIAVILINKTPVPIHDIDDLLTKQRLVTPMWR
jgi:glycine hydroxymethyltransferase